MNKYNLTTVNYDRKVKTVLSVLEGRGIPIDPVKWYAGFTEADAQAKAQGEHDVRVALSRQEHLPLLIKHDGKLHPIWAVTASTGRVAARSPAFQTISKGSLRNAFGDGENLVVALDWKSSHPAILAAISGDEALRDDCKAGLLYSRVAKEAGCELADAKLSILKMMNGGAPTVESVKDLFNVGGAYAVAGAWIKDLVKRAEITRKVDLGGVSYPLPDGKGAHAALSAVLQRVEVEAMIAAAYHLIMTEEEPGQAGHGGKLFACVHDELLFLCPTDRVEELIKAGEHAMTSAMFDVGVVTPPEVKARVGWTWGELFEKHDEPGVPITPSCAKIKPRVAWLHQGIDAVKVGTLVDAGDVFGVMVAAVDKDAELRVALTSPSVTGEFRRKISAYQRLAKDRTKGIRESDVDVAPPMFKRGSQAEMAEVLKSRLTVEDAELVCDAGHIHRSTGGFWVEMSIADLSRVVQSWDGTRVGDSDKSHELRISASDVFGTVSLFKDKIDAPGFFDAVSNVVVFQDRVLTMNGEVRPVSSLDRVRECDSLDLEYSADAKCPRWISFLGEVFQGAYDTKERVMFLQEWIGAALWGIATKYRGIPVLTGDGNNGKSVLIESVQSLFPKLVQSTVDLAKLSGSKSEYYVMSLKGKRLNSVTELPKTYVEDTGIFKAAVLGEPITGRDPADKPTTFNPIAAWILALNTFPSVSDLSRGFWSRIKILSFDRIFEQGKDMDPDLKGKLFAERMGIILWALEGAQRLVKNGGYTDPPSSKNHIDEWRGISDSVAAYAADQINGDIDDTHFQEVEVTVQELYDHYKKWCDDNGYKNPCTKITFGKRLTVYGVPEPIVKWKGGASIKVRMIRHKELRETNKLGTWSK